MARKFSTAQIRETFWIAFPALAIVVGAFWLTFQFVEPAPPRKITLATGGVDGAYFAFGQQYAEILKRSGIKVEVLKTSGSIENLEQVTKDSGNAEIALLQGGIADQTSAPDVVSLGRVFLEPLWVFYRGDVTVDWLGQLKGLRVAIGGKQSGTHHLAVELFKNNKILLSDFTPSEVGGIAAVRALEKGEVDAAFFVLSPKSKLVSRLLDNSDIRLMSFARADAYSRILPYLNRVVLPQGVFSLSKNVPSRDVTLLAASTALVVHRDFHPALAGLIAEAAVEVHKKGGLFEKSGQFPTGTDPEFPMSKDAARVYEFGPPFMQRYVPFWLASLLTRMVVMLVPIATILLPLIKIVPFLYKWAVRRRILYWYQLLKSVEVDMSLDPEGKQTAAQIAEVDRIEDSVNNIRLPIGFADQLYDLRGAIDLVRQRLEFRSKNGEETNGGFIPAQPRVT